MEPTRRGFPRRLEQIGRFADQSSTSSRSLHRRGTFSLCCAARKERNERTGPPASFPTLSALPMLLAFRTQWGFYPGNKNCKYFCLIARDLLFSL